MFLAYNNYSDVQALTFTKDQSEVWAVQYHPEFSPYWVSGLMSMRKEILLENKIYDNEEDFRNMYKYLSNFNKNKKLEKELKLNNSLIDNSIRYIELHNWLKYLN